MFLKRICAVAWLPHHLEHLIPLCLALEGTLIVASSDLARTAQQLYPPLPILDCRSTETSAFVLLGDLCRLYLARFEVVLYSHLLRRSDLARAFGTLGPAAPRVVYCPHGLSEKPKRWSALAAWQDVALFYGDFNVKQLRSWDVSQYLTCYCYMGHMLKRFYSQYHATLLLPERDSVISAKRKILYTPTWHDNTGTSSFIETSKSLLTGITSNDVLLIKPHPLTRKELVSALEHETASQDNVLVITNDPRTIPFLEWADVLITDMSSIAYDFLYLEKPLVLMNPGAGTTGDCSKTELFQCGLVIGPEDTPDLFKAIDESCASGMAWSSARWSLYSSVFAQVTNNEMLGALQEAMAQRVPRWLANAP